jgi:hypothetical protein
MNIDKLAQTPELIKIELTDSILLDKYTNGEPIVFWIKSHIGISGYFEFYKAQAEGNSDGLEKLMRSLILNEQGDPTIPEGKMLPIDISLAALAKINDYLGK